ncbi:MAG: GYF domain-containing protein [Thiothrix sp.]|uniref:GYF domain-containing protein n=1 Tax=Thiothrix sp. TaxID=1032 RepID=UPI0026183798|nr:GYF domain-containing protein [Thiothrix sp.]MDD5395561.1 GYF domain-containing protein [Thiothrix sp.]
MSSYLVSRNGEQFGPYSVEEFAAYIKSGQILPDDLAWKEGMASWLPVSKIPTVASQEASRIAPPMPHSSPAVAQMEIEEPWKTKFALIEKAGGYKLPHFRDLTYGERRKVVINFWGFFFVGFYYLAKGMWKKAIVLTTLCFAAIVILEMILHAMGITNTRITSFIASAVFATRANIDYYKKMVLNDNGWW